MVTLNLGTCHEGTLQMTHLISTTHQKRRHPSVPPTKGYLLESSLAVSIITLIRLRFPIWNLAEKPTNITMTILESPHILPLYIRQVSLLLPSRQKEYKNNNKEHFYVIWRFIFLKLFSIHYNNIKKLMNMIGNLIQN